jgi:hypothetical protein
MSGQARSRWLSGQTVLGSCFLVQGLGRPIVPGPNGHLYCRIWTEEELQEVLQHMLLIKRDTVTAVVL